MTMSTDPCPLGVLTRFLRLFSRHASAAALVAATLLYALPAFAQGTATGVVSGRVSNAATLKYLAGAEVVDKATSRSVYTDTDGSFSISLPEGDRTLVIAYGGLDTAEVAVQVVAGTTIVKEVALTGTDYAALGETLQLDAFVVSGEREGRAASIAQQKASDTMVNVLSSDEFPNVAGANLGDFLRNIPGIDIMDNGSDPRDIRIRGMDSQTAGVTSDGMRMANAAGTDGNTRAFNLDQISIQNYETIEIYKTPTAAMAADSGGGSINLVSKSAFNLKRSRMSFQAGGMVNSENMHLGRKPGSSGDDYAIRPAGNFYYANSFLKNRLGVVFTANYNDFFSVNENATGTRRTIYDQDAATANYHPGKPDYGVYTRGMSYGYGGGFTRRTSVSLNFDFKLTEHIKLYANSQVNTSFISSGIQALTVGNVDINSAAVEGGTATGLVPDHWGTSSQGYQIPIWSPYTATVVTGSNDVRANTVQDAANSKSAAYATTGLEILNKIGRGTMFALGAEYKRNGWKINLDGGVSLSTNRYTTQDGLQISAANVYLRGIDYRIDHAPDSDYPLLTQLNGIDIYDLSNYVSRVSSSSPLVSIAGTNRNVPASTGGTLVIPGVSTNRTYPNVQMERGDYAPFQVSNGRWLATKDKFTTAKLDAKRSFSTRFPMYLQAGGIFREQERRTDKNGQSRWFFNGTTEELRQVLQAAKSPDLNETFGPYRAVPYLSLAYIDQYFRENRDKFDEDVVWRTETERAGDKLSRERVTGGYGMFNIRLWGLSTLLGARYERTNQSGRGPITDNDATAVRASEMLMDYVRGYGYADITAAYNDTSINPITGRTGQELVTNYTVSQAQALELTRLRFSRQGTVDKTYADWFPNVQLKYNLTPNLLLRGSYNKSISRQPFDRLLPGYSVSVSSESVYSVSMNNPSLKPVYYDNYDVAVEYYTKQGGSFSLGYFYKNVKNYTVTTTEVIDADTVSDYDLSAYIGGELTRPTNAGGAKHKGYEASVSQRLGVFTDWLKAFQIYASYTYVDAESSSSFGSTDSSTGLDDRPTYMPVVNVVPKKYKINLNYQHRWLTASLSYNWTSKYMSGGPYRLEGGKEDSAFTYLYREARGTFDTAVSVPLYKGYSFYAEAKNLTNVPVRTFMDNSKWRQNYNRYGAFVYFGIKGNF